MEISDRQEKGEGLPTSGAVPSRIPGSGISVLGGRAKVTLHTHAQVRARTGHKVREVVVLERMGDKG